MPTPKINNTVRKYFATTRLDEGLARLSVIESVAKNEAFEMIEIIRQEFGQTVFKNKSFIGLNGAEARADSIFSQKTVTLKDQLFKIAKVIKSVLAGKKDDLILEASLTANKAGKDILPPELLPGTKLSDALKEDWRVIRLAREGDREAAGALYKRHQGLIATIIHKHSVSDGNREGLEMEDMMSYGYMGLMKACGKFDPNRGLKFSSYLSWWVRPSVNGAISKSALLHRSTIVNTNIKKFIRFQSELTQKLEREPSLLEMAKAMLMSPEKALELREMAAQKILSLNAPTSENGTGQFQDYLADEGRGGESEMIEKIDQQNLERKLMEALKILSEREREVLKKRMGLHGSEELTLEKIGKSLKTPVSRERARQIEGGALKKIKLKLGSMGTDEKILESM